MIDATRLKDDLKKQVTALEKDLHHQLKHDSAFAAPLRVKYDQAFQSRRTASTFIAWAENEITQAAVAWVLATVFVRFLEDNGLIPDPILSGPPERLRLAQDALVLGQPRRRGDSIELDASDLWRLDSVTAAGIALHTDRIEPAVLAQVAVPTPNWLLP